MWTQTLGKINLQINPIPATVVEDGVVYVKDVQSSIANNANTA